MMPLRFEAQADGLTIHDQSGAGRARHSNVLPVITIGGGRPNTPPADAPRCARVACVLRAGPRAPSCCPGVVVLMRSLQRAGRAAVNDREVLTGEEAADRAPRGGVVGAEAVGALHALELLNGGHALGGVNEQIKLIAAAQSSYASSRRERYGICSDARGGILVQGRGLARHRRHRNMGAIAHLAGRRTEERLEEGRQAAETVRQGLTNHERASRSAAASMQQRASSRRASGSMDAVTQPKPPETSTTADLREAE